MQVRGLDLNQGSPNLLASGSTDGETLVWDLNAAEPSSYKVVSIVVATNAALHVKHPATYFTPCCCLWCSDTAEMDICGFHQMPLQTSRLW